MAEETKSEITTTDAKIQKYLVGGEQTKITPEIQRLADTIVRGELLQTSIQILNVIHQLEKRRDKGDLLNTRTADQIIISGFRTGCTDMALAFAAISRAFGIPTKILVTADRSWLLMDGGEESGHDFVQIYDTKSESWILIDPVGKELGIELPPDRVIICEGIDGWDMGMKGKDGKLTRFNDFKSKWREENIS